jgi:hypothetical protein
MKTTENNGFVEKTNIDMIPSDTGLRRFKQNHFLSNGGYI